MNVGRGSSGPITSASSRSASRTHPPAANGTNNAPIVRSKDTFECTSVTPAAEG